MIDVEQNEFGFNCDCTDMCVIAFTTYSYIFLYIMCMNYEHLISLDV